MILEGIVTTLNESKRLNIAPMGPTVSEKYTLEGLQSFQLRPFPTSKTFQNLQRHPEGVFHVTDDVLLFAEAAIGKVVATPETLPAKMVEGQALATSCRYYEFVARISDTTGQRMVIDCDIVQTVRLRDFFGMNRAKSAVLELTIMATRIDFLPKQEILSKLEEVVTIVEKTGGLQESAALDLLKKYLDDHLK